MGGLGWKWEVVEKGEFGGVDGIGKLSGPIEAGGAWAERRRAAKRAILAKGTR